VSSKVKETAAKFTVRHPDEVMQLLQGLVDWAASEDNAWQGKNAIGSIWQPDKKYDASGAAGVDNNVIMASSLYSYRKYPADLDVPNALESFELDGGENSSAEQQKWKEWQQQVGDQKQTES
jgi:hypothetical protein